jgi:hypothetical protein
MAICSVKTFGAWEIQIMYSLGFPFLYGSWLNIRFLPCSNGLMIMGLALHGLIP